ncbi:MAG: tRNA (N(6)-L-threonylcarbamoyladenosine(37)-C(2))-methylthiotransferase MtaB [Candidatus Poribacteria bacterium]|nr:tRNA (N(6)-L-threonylcarbamoyladenosine(37)-C(2))-methylthiotransferase MtaB [Candidatus Poribacteria bacterium]|tara:strand:- start:4046 stop:5494 length:1449 start_codon:yes stop_codon:yes gene_type:complete
MTEINPNSTNVVPTAAILTFGCKVNQYDSNAMRSTLIRKGYRIVSETQSADVYIVNTCTVTNVADQKARQIIRRVAKKNPQAKVLVTGCYAESDRGTLEGIDGVSLVFGNREKADLDQYLEKIQPNQPNSDLLQIEPVQHDAIREHANFSLSVADTGDRTRGIIKVQDGCSAFCTYCIIPYVRGRMTSRPISEIIAEAKMLSLSGAKEIVLTGVHLGSYGIDKQNTGELTDRSRRETVADILEAVHSINGIERIRLSSIEPMNFPFELVARMANLPKCMPHFHLPLQSGSDQTLERMRRRYTADEFMRLVDHIRSVFPEVGLTTDIMVGFPGETNQDFEESLQFVNKIGFSQLHVFRYSPRNGTPAAEFENQIPSHISSERSKRMIEIGRESADNFRQKMIGRATRILVESVTDNCQGSGFTDNYLRTEINGYFRQTNQIIPVVLTGIKGDVMQAEIIDFSYKNNNLDSSISPGLKFLDSSI